MRVLSCNRKSCENIMCDRFSYKYGYICDECFDELIYLGWETDISNFMRSDKTINYMDAAFERFNAEFSIQR